jgi:2-methylcitrate dehydratase PrpD
MQEKKTQKENTQEQEMRTRQLSNFLVSLRYEDLGEKAVSLLKMYLLDFLGVAFAGSQADSSRILREYFVKNRMGCATVMDRFLACSEESNSAAVNAAYGHAQDLDDLHNSSIVHLGVVTCPTALALGQSRKIEGREVLLAIAAGYEAGARVGETITPASYKYWHTTAIAGGFASTATAGKLLGLSETQMIHAFGSAGTQAAGLWEFLQDGAMSKCLHVANANLCGIRSAHLAALGFTGAQRILEGERGFVKAVAPQYNLDCLTRNLGFGNSLKLHTNSLKPYACCRHTHSADYGILSLKKEYGLTAEQVVFIEDFTYRTAIDTADNPNPTNPYAAKFSLQYCLAAAIVLGHLNDEAFNLKYLNDPAIRDLMRKITVKQDEVIEAEILRNPDRWGHRLKICLSDGRMLDRLFEYPWGDFHNPFDWQAAEEKTTSLMKVFFTEESIRQFCSFVRDFENLKDISLLFSILKPR